ncbi:hypothetical protein B0H14DRAFT_3426920 [Mycena olivaceomarginata]|nr:hypothetical protein B0H14DRAFT_3426920 [Mycena olivaceomarginata]
MSFCASLQVTESLQPVRLVITPTKGAETLTSYGISALAYDRENIIHVSYQRRDLLKFIDAPKFQQNIIFFHTHSTVSLDSRPMPRLKLVRMMPDFEKQVRAASPASHTMWAIGVVHAREDVDNAVEEPKFDYIAYAQCRIAGFRQELKQLGPGLRIE